MPKCKELVLELLLRGPGHKTSPSQPQESNSITHNAVFLGNTRKTKRVEMKRDWREKGSRADIRQTLKTNGEAQT